MKSVEYSFGKPVDMHALNRTIAWRKKTQIEIEKRLQNVKISGFRDKCPICGTTDSTSLLTVHQFEYALCALCGHVYCTSVVDTKYSHALYEAENMLSQAYLDPEVRQTRINSISIPKVSYVTEIIGSSKNKEWLDIGCGGCDILQAAEQLGWRVQGIEPSEADCTFGRSKGFNIQQAYITEENAGALIGDPDVISLFLVLEQMDNPYAIISTLGDTLIQGKYLVVESQRYPSLSAWVCQLYPEQIARYLVPPFSTHIFSEVSMTRMLQENGFTVTNIWNYGQDFYEMLSMMTMVANRETDSWPKEIFSCINAVQEQIDKHKMSDFMLVVAKKD